jgi:hypothetical protein
MQGEDKLSQVTAFLCPHSLQETSNWTLEETLRIQIAGEGHNTGREYHLKHFRNSVYLPV